MPEATLEMVLADMLERAAQHERAADEIAAARAENPRVVDDARTWGRQAAEVRMATVRAVNAREQKLLLDERRERELAAQLRAGAAAFEEMNQRNRAHLDIST